MTSNVGPTVRRRRLGQELRRLRQEKGMTAEEVAEELMVSQSKISRLENGRRSISQRDVRDLCRTYKVEDKALVDSLMQMAKESRQQGWWNAFGDVPYSVYIGFETDAASLRVYEPQVLPGLLQTPDYAEAVISGALPEAPQDQIAQRVQVRLRRQERITDPLAPLRLWAVVDEAAMRRVVGNSKIMSDQLDYLVRMSHEPHVTVQALPFDMGSHPGMSGQFTILEFSDESDTSVVYLEGVTSDLYLEKLSDVQSYSMMYEHLRAQALNADQSRQFITEMAQEHAHAAPGGGRGRPGGLTGDGNAPVREMRGGRYTSAPCCGRGHGNMPSGRVNGPLSRRCCRVTSVTPPNGGGSHQQKASEQSCPFSRERRACG